MTRYIQADVVDIFDDDIVARIEAARSLDTRPSILSRLSEDKDGRVRFWVGQNPNTPEDVRQNIYDLEDLKSDYIECYLGIDVYGDYNQLFNGLDEALNNVVYSYGGEYIGASEGRYNYEDDNDIEINIRFLSLHDYAGQIANGIEQVIGARGFDILTSDFY